MMDYKGKKVLVAGAARSGVASAALLKGLGAAVTLTDLKKETEIKLDKTELDGVALYLGEPAENIVKNFDFIVVSPGIPLTAPIFLSARETNIPVIGEIELAYSVCKGKVAAVTGTNGKTTTTALLGEILAAEYSGSVTVGNIGVPFAEKAAGISEDAYAALEVSSFQLETIHSFSPHVAAILNVTPDHLDRHGNVENYALVKSRIFENQTKEDFAVINYDDLICREMAVGLPAKVVFFSRREILSEGFYAENGGVFHSEGGKKELILPVSDIKIPGVHNLENVLAAAAVAYQCGVSIETIRKTVAGFSGVPHRIELVRELDGVKYYNDSKATNVDSALKAIDALSAPLLVIAGGRDKNLDFVPFAKALIGRARKLVLIGEAAGKIKDACDYAGFSEVLFAENMQIAVHLCRENAREGDVVLLSPACASFDMFTGYEQRGDVFRQTVSDLK